MRNRNLEAGLTLDDFFCSAMIFLISSILFLLLLHACTPEKQASAEEVISGFLGEHSLIRVEKIKGVKGDLSGSFFLGSGSIRGSMDTEFKLQFYWSPKPKEILITSLPYSKFRFILDETKDIPTVNFIFDPEWLERPAFSDCPNCNNNPQYLNFNDVLASKNLITAIVRISPSTLEKEIYLPKTIN